MSLLPQQDDEFTAALKRREEEQLAAEQERLRVAGATTTSPDRAAEIARIQNRLGGAPRSFVERNFDTLKPQIDAEELAEKLKTAPVLKSAMQDPAFAAAAKDDTDTLAGLERTLGWGEAVARAIDQGQQMFGGFAEASGELVGADRLTAIGRTIRERNAAQVQAYGPRASFTGIRDLGDVGQYLTETLGEMIPIMAPSMAGALAGGAAGAAAGTVTLPVIGTVAGATIGALLGGFIPAFALGVGEVQSNIKERDPNAINPAAAFLGGTAVAAFDTVLPGKIGSRLVRTFGQEVAEEVAKRTFQKVVRPRFMRDVTGKTVQGFATEGLTEAVQEAIGEIATERATGQGPGLLSQEMGVQMLEAAIAGGIMGGTMDAGARVISQRALERRAVAAEQSQLLFQAIAQGAVDSKLIARLPEAAQRWATERLKDGPIADLYIDPEKFTEYFQGKDENPALIAAELTGDPDALEKAQRNLEPLRIPTAAYAVKLAGTAHHGPLEQDLRLGSPAAMSRREVIEYRKKTLADQQTAAASGVLDEVQQVRAQLIEQFTEGGRVPRGTAERTAVAFESAFVALARRKGVQLPLLELYGRYGLTVERRESPEAGTGAPAEQPARQEAAGAPQPEGGATPRPEGAAPQGEAAAQPAGPSEPPAGGTTAQERPAGPWDANTTPGAADAQGLTTRLDPDEPIDVMSDVGAAAARMMAENPNIMREAAALRARSQASRKPAPPRAIPPAVAEVMTELLGVEPGLLSPAPPPPTVTVGAGEIPAGPGEFPAALSPAALLLAADWESSPNRADISGLVESIRQEGIRVPVVMQREVIGDAVIETLVDGKHRARAAAELGLTSVPVVWQHPDTGAIIEEHTILELEQGAVGDPFVELSSVEAFTQLAQGGQIHQATGTFTEAEAAATSPISSGETAGYSAADIARFFLERRGGNAQLAAYEFVKALHAEGRPVSAALWDEVATRPPDGYVRRGERYQPKQANAAGLRAVAPQGRDPRELAAIALYKQRGAGFSIVRMAQALREQGIRPATRTRAEKLAANRYVEQLVQEAEGPRPADDSPFREFFQGASQADLRYAPAAYQNGGRLVISSRIPTAVDRRIRLDVLKTDLSVLDEPEAIEAGARATYADYVRQHMPVLTDQDLRETKGDDRATIERAVQRVMDNLRWLWQVTPAETRERSKRWYEGAHLIANELAAQYDVTVAQAAGVLACLSPQMDWFKNVDLARRVFAIYHEMDRTDGVLTADLFKSYADAAIERAHESHKKAHKGAEAATRKKREQLVEKNRAKGKPAPPEFRQMLLERRQQIDAVLAGTITKVRDEQKAYAGRRWSQLDDTGRALMIRTIDENQIDRRYQVITPEGQNAGPQVNLDGTPSAVGWGTFGFIAKSASILRDGSEANINEKVGIEHKVRSFFNNISDPDSGDFVTMDTHAVAAAYLLPLSGEHALVRSVLGGAPSVAAAGLSGTNLLVAEAYFRLGKELGVLPREVQSVTWEAVRGLFKPDQKKGEQGKALLATIGRLNTQFRKGKLDADGYYSGIVAAAGSIQPPDWLTRPTGLAVDESRLPAPDVWRRERARVSPRRGDPRGRAAGAGRFDTIEPDRILGGAPEPADDVEFFQSAPATPTDPPFYSRLIRAVEASTTTRATGAQWKATIKNSKLGISQDEFTLTHTDDLEDGRTYTRPEVLEYLRANAVTIEVIKLGEELDEQALWREAQAEQDREREAERERTSPPDFEQMTGWQIDVNGSDEEGWSYSIDGEEDGDRYDTAEEAEAAAEEYASRRLDDHRDDLESEWWREWEHDFDQDHPLRDYVEELRREAEDAGTDRSAHFSSYVAKAGAEHIVDDSYREVFLTNPPPPLSPEQAEFDALSKEVRGNTPVEVRQGVQPRYRPALNNADRTWSIVDDEAQRAPEGRYATREEAEARAQFENEQWRDSNEKGRWFTVTRNGVWGDAPYETRELALSTISRQAQRWKELEGILVKRPQSVDEMTVGEMRAWYREQVGYDPMVDDPTLTPEQLEDTVREMRTKLGQEPASRWQDGHDDYWAIANPIVRVRYDLRQFGDLRGLTPDEKLVFFINEIQPPQTEQQKKMPPLFLKNWRELGLKWALREAVTLGATHVAWTTGQMQIDLYPSVETEVREITYARSETDNLQVDIVLRDARVPVLQAMVNPQGVITEGFQPESKRWAGAPLENVVGKEIAERILNGGVEGRLAEEGLKVGGKGLRKLYDKDLPAVAGKLVKKAGAKVAPISIGTGRRVNPELNATRILFDRSVNALVDHLVANAGYTRPAALDFVTNTRAHLKRDSGSTNPKTLELVNALVDAREAMAALPSWIEEDQQVLAIEITPEVAAMVEGGQAYFQPQQDDRSSGDEAPPRGSFKWRKDPKQATGRRAVISLFSEADESTLLHEGAHLFLEIMRDLADQSPEIAADLDLVRAWAKDPDNPGPGFSRKQHEQFARGFELYLREGKAPSMGLRNVFSTFRAWMCDIYRSARQLDVTINDDIRGVFDRLLATDEALAEARAVGQLVPLFTTAKDAGMSDEEFAPYRLSLVNAGNEEREKLEQQLLREIRREETAARKAKQQEVLAAVTAEVNARPVYRALALIQRGTNPDGSAIEGVAEPLKLSRKIIAARHGIEALANLPRGVLAPAAEGGLDPEAVATRAEFGSSGELIAALTAAPPRRQVIAEEVKRRMAEIEPSLMADRGKLLDAAYAAMAGEARTKVIHAELTALAALQRTVQPHVKVAKQEGAQALRDEKRERAYERRYLEAEAKLAQAIAVGEKEAQLDLLRKELSRLKERARRGAATLRGAIPDQETFRLAAEKRIAGMVGRSINPQVFWSAARKASMMAAEAAARQDFAAAITAKQQELLNLELFKQAQHAKEDIERRAARARALNKTSARERLAKAGGGYLDQVLGVLDRFEFAPISKKELKRRASLIDWLNGLSTQGLPAQLPEALVNESLRTNYAELTYAELIDVTDGLQQIVHLSRLKNRLLKSKQQRDLQASADALVASIRTHKATPARRPERDRRPEEETRRTIGDYLASSRKLGSLLREMDGFVDGGKAWELIMLPLNRAGAREAEMTAAASAELHRLVEGTFPGVQKKQLYDKLPIDAIGQSLSLMQRLVIAMHWGSDGNRERLMKAEGWSEAQVQAIVETLTPPELQFVQGVVDHINSYWDQIAAKEKRVTGLAPEKVDAVAWSTPNGAMRGGYFPIKYDDRLNAKALSFPDMETAELAKAAAYGSVQTKRGHTEARVKITDLPMRQDFGVIFEHIGQVIHDLSHHEVLIDVSRILGHPEVSKAIIEMHGDIVLKQIRNTVRDVAFGDEPARGGFEKAINHIRIGSTVASLGWNLGTSIMQPLGLFNSAHRIGYRHIVRGLSRTLRSPSTLVATNTWINEKSSFMRSRSRTQQREINEIRNTLGVGSGRITGWIDEVIDKTYSPVTRHAMAESYFALIAAAQRFADVPTWVGMYEKQMALGVPEERAIELADQAVLDSQGGGQIKDLAGIQRGGPMLKLWTNFFTFFSVLYQQLVETKRRTDWTDPAQVAKAAVDYLTLLVIPAMASYTIREIMRRTGDPEDEDEPGELVQRVAIETAAYASGTMLGVREVSSVFAGAVGYEGPAGARFFASLTRAGVQYKQGEVDEAALRATADVVGPLLHLPTGQAMKTILGVMALMEGRTTNPMAVVAGPPPKK